MDLAGPYLFHQTNKIPMHKAVVTVAFAQTSRFTVVELPFADEIHSFGIILPSDSDAIDYSPNNVPKLMCGEFKYLLQKLKPRTISLIMPLFMQEQIHDTHRAKLVLQNGCVRSYNESNVQVIANKVFLFYVRKLGSKSILLAGDYQGLASEKD